ncbi:MAG: hypothetical protein LBQ21_06965 [Clostridiales Family XIII bacterium]|nr:hypothetical protein [Clostridiales Family XIII bacterium]
MDFKKSKFSIFLFIFALIMLVYTVVSGIFLTKDLMTMFETGQATVEGYEFQIINYYVTGVLVYLLYTVILVALGRLFLKFKDKPAAQSEEISEEIQEEIQDSDTDAVVTETVALDPIAPKTVRNKEKRTKAIPDAADRADAEVQSDAD